jgi:hypothetical protein
MHCAPPYCVIGETEYVCVCFNHAANKTAHTRVNGRENSGRQCRFTSYPEQTVVVPFAITFSGNVCFLASPAEPTAGRYTLRSPNISVFPCILCCTLLHVGACVGTHVQTPARMKRDFPHTLVRE